MHFPLVIYDDDLWPKDSSAEMIVSSQLPQPYRSLLAHTEHMTVTVEAHYGGPVDVRVLESSRHGEFYHRRIVLTRHGSDQIVQYGLVRLNLGCCSEPVRQAIVAEKTPLGRVLIEHNVLRRVQPTAFLRVSPGPTLCRQLELHEPYTLFGRTGVIFFDDRPAISVLEILTPTEERFVS
jgi:chorismate-pyruvate lyase